MYPNKDIHSLWCILASQCHETATGMMNYHGGGADIFDKSLQCLNPKGVGIQR